MSMKITKTEPKNKAVNDDLLVMPPVLDACCGPKGFWFDKNDERALFIDRRSEDIEMDYPSGHYREQIKPDYVIDFTRMPFKNDTFNLVVFDPPHLPQEEPSGRIVARYGHLKGDWRKMLKDGFAECFRVLKPNGVLIFKWNEVRIPVKEILELTNQKPLFGHKSGKNMQTHWIAFLGSA